jgi:hypothetical protein
MRIFAGLSLAVLFSCGLFAQHSGARGASGGYHHAGGYRVGGSGVVGSNRGVVIPYAYPVYFGSGYYYGSSYGDGSYPDGSYPTASYPPPQAQQPSNVTVVYPPAYPPQPGPGMVNQFGPGPMPPPGANSGPVSPYEPSTAQTAPDQPSTDHYLVALKDHTIYSVVAYWIDGDTLHYFTAGNVHNQASLSLVDRDLTARLNKESGTQIDIPPAK